MPEEEPVKTFGNFTERSWLVIMLFVDIMKQIYDDIVALWGEVTLSWMDEMDAQHRQQEEDRTLYAAA